MNNLYCGNCVDIMQTFPDGCIDLTVTSPPYDNLRDYEGYDFDFESIAKELYRVTKDGGAVVWVVGDATINGSETGTSFRQALHFKDIGFKIHDTMIYLKPNFSAVVALRVRYAPVFEYMFVFVKGKLTTFNPLKDRPCKECVKTGNIRNRDGTMKRMSNEGRAYGKEGFGQRYNVWQINPQSNGHPAPFPEALARDHILSWSNVQDMVLDPMCGSGTTCIAAKKLNRKYIGIDCSEKYIEMTKERLKHE